MSNESAPYLRRLECIRRSCFRTDVAVLWLGEYPATILTTTERGMVLISLDEPCLGLCKGEPRFVEPETLQRAPA
jgi:hypothetical protein